MTSTNNHALITGASSGIGAEYARQLAAQGHTLTLVARRAELLEDLAAELRAQYRVTVSVLPADLATADGVARVADYITSAGTGGGGPVTLLVNNAGFNKLEKFHEVAPSIPQDMLYLHANASLMLMQAALPSMVAAGRGAVINVASVAAFVPGGGATYHASKLFLVALSESVQADLRGTGVRVQALCPGFTDTPLFGVIGADYEARAKQMPAWLLMSPVQVVAESLAALHSKRVVVVPGAQYKALTWLLRNRLLGALWRWVLHQ
jgi:uncharacterized protein